MNFGSFKYLIKEGFRSIWSHRLMSIASILVLMSCLILMGAAMMLSVNVSMGLKAAEDMNVIVVHIEDDTSDEDIEILKQSILSTENVKECTFVSSEETFESIVNETDFPELFEGLDNVDLDHFYPDKFDVVINDNSLHAQTVKSLETLPNVLQIRASFETAETLAKLRNFVNIFGVSIIAIMFVISVFIISNTIKLTMYSRRLEISIMKAVGATDRFIRTPFVVGGFVIGLFASITSYGFVFVFYTLATDAINELISATATPFVEVALPLAGAFLAIGTLTGMFGSVISMGKYLRKEGSEISAI